VEFCKFFRVFPIGTLSIQLRPGSVSGRANRHLLCILWSSTSRLECCPSGGRSAWKWLNRRAKVNTRHSAGRNTSAPLTVCTWRQHLALWRRANTHKSNESRPLFASSRHLSPLVQSRQTRASQSTRRNLHSARFSSRAGRLHTSKLYNFTRLPLAVDLWPSVRQQTPISLSKTPRITVLARRNQLSPSSRQTEKEKQ